MNQNRVLILIIATALALNAQWLNYPAPVANERGDFAKFHGNLAADLKRPPLQLPAEAL